MAPLDKAPAAALQIAEAARLVRGYGATCKRGMRNWRLIKSEIVKPCLNGARPPTC